MFYLKKKINNDIEMKIDLYDDEIYTKCAKCGKEFKVDSEFLAHVIEDGELARNSSILL